MARKKDANSTRQQAFARLDEMIELPRQEAVETIMEEFDISKPYAMTLYQSHRTAKKKEGAYTQVFRVRDVRDGMPVDPYLSTRHVLKPTRSDAKTAAGAVSKYESEQLRKIKAAKALK